MKRASGKDSADTAPKRRIVSLATFRKWQTQYEREYQTMSWLHCDTDASDDNCVKTLWCHACRGNEDKIIGLKNYSSAWVSGSTNHKINCVIDHARSDQHSVAMIQMRKASSTSIVEYSPIARSLLVMDKEIQERINKKFDICYLMGKECITVYQHCRIPAEYPRNILKHKEKTADIIPTETT